MEQVWEKGGVGGGRGGWGWREGRRTGGRGSRHHIWVAARGRWWWPRGRNS